ncbi:MAG: hypothetical protein AAGJ18_26345 [Bacteroidota bacterium]
MKETKLYTLKKITDNTWFITIVSSMFGIIVGLHFTNYNEQMKLAADKATAFQIVVDELEDNHQNLKKFNDTLQVYYDPFIHIMNYYMLEEEEILIPVDSLDVFIEKTKKIFAYSESELINEKELRVSGTLAFEVFSDAIISNLSHIVWDTYKQGDFMSISTFRCLREIDKIYQVQSKVDEANKKWMNSLFSMQFGVNASTLRSLINNWTKVLQDQKLLLELYEIKADILKNCR